ncbi:MAG: DUF3828 domain-containing protein [Proteobacteria bacterium]|nr:DUF3828 domain-containing protein [Pseudomonadota bacterium]
MSSRVPGRRLATALLLAVPTSALASTIVAPSVMAQGQTPQAFLDGLYQPYRQEGFKGQPYWEPRRFFAPDLAAAIEKDVAAARQHKEAPLLDGDPFVDAQDWQITDLTIVASAGDNTAQGAVAFRNLGEPKTLTVLLIRTPQGWRISDIVSATGSLRKLYRLP